MKYDIWGFLTVVYLINTPESYAKLRSDYQYMIIKGPHNPIPERKYSSAGRLELTKQLLLTGEDIQSMGL